MNKAFKVAGWEKEHMVERRHGCHFLLWDEALERPVAQYRNHWDADKARDRGKAAGANSLVVYPFADLEEVL